MLKSTPRQTISRPKPLSLHHFFFHPMTQQTLFGGLGAHLNPIRVIYGVDILLVVCEKLGKIQEHWSKPTQKSTTRQTISRPKSLSLHHFIFILGPNKHCLVDKMPI
jgi:hypothetical protein